MFKSISQNLKKNISNLEKRYRHRHDPVYLDWYFNHSHRLKQFKDIHKGKSAFIIGNGPSLKEMDLSLLRDKYTFGLNKIYLLFDKVDLNLDYLVSVNSLAIQQSVEKFESFDFPCFLSAIESKSLVANKEHIYRIMRSKVFAFGDDISKPIHEGYTVTYVALQIAYYMGFSRVFLIGVDHNFKATGKPNEEQILVGEDQNHFAPDYFGGQRWHLPDLEASELAYHLANFHYRRADREIYDATLNGKLKIFPKVSFQEAVDNSIT